MPEFCTCGSIVIGGRCTNKNCTSKAAAKPAAEASNPSKKESKPKSTKTRRASKCITYNLYEQKNEENIN